MTSRKKSTGSLAVFLGSLPWLTGARCAAGARPRRSLFLAVEAEHWRPAAVEHKEKVAPLEAKLTERGQ